MNKSIEKGQKKSKNTLKQNQEAQGKKEMLLMSFGCIFLWNTIVVSLVVVAARYVDLLEYEPVTVTSALRLMETWEI